MCARDRLLFDKMHTALSIVREQLFQSLQQPHLSSDMTQLSQVFSARLTFNSSILISSNLLSVLKARSQMTSLRRRGATTCYFPPGSLQVPKSSTPLVVPSPRLSYPCYKTGLIQTTAIPIQPTCCFLYFFQVFLLPVSCAVFGPSFRTLSTCITFIT